MSVRGALLDRTSAAAVLLVPPFRGHLILARGRKPSTKAPPKGTNIPEVGCRGNRPSGER